MPKIQRRVGNEKTEISMKSLAYLSHETALGKEIILPASNEMQKFIIEYGEKLCHGDILKSDSSVYCKDNLEKFIYDMYLDAKNVVKLDEVCNHFHDELLRIQRKQLEIMKIVVEKME